ncbi:hypothetical protein ATO49_10510 [Mycolicibacterium fortuitum subsp. fortuitum DSM 46621 = ATCC 6841 = JCM 6387]|nr:hypothetical protein ATO49_10510 [Mycolicibacterium fortuitum subsp. fortuitum DSM 46621 = ATCC 6841 = JCM 6387]
MSHDHRAEARTDQAPGAQRDDRRPVHRRDHDERDRGNGVGHTEDHILGGVGVCQCRAAGTQQQRQQQHAGSGAEVAAVDGDQKDRAGLHRDLDPMAAVVGHPGFPLAAPRHQNRHRRERQEHRDHPLEALGRGTQQQGCADSSAGHCYGDDPLEPGSLSG